MENDPQSESDDLSEKQLAVLPNQVSSPFVPEAVRWLNGLTTYSLHAKKLDRNFGP